MSKVRRLIPGPMHCVCYPHGWIIAGHWEGESFQRIETFASEVHSCAEGSWSRRHGGDYQPSASNRISDRTQCARIHLHQGVVAGSSKIARDALGERVCVGSRGAIVQSAEPGGHQRSVSTEPIVFVWIDKAVQSNRRRRTITREQITRPGAGPHPVVRTGNIRTNSPHHLGVAGIVRRDGEVVARTEIAIKDRLTEKMKFGEFSSRGTLRAHSTASAMLVPSFSGCFRH